MLKQGENSHIVNTAPQSATCPPGSGVYAASKHAVVAATECLYHELRAQNAPIGVSVLCPAFVDTGISNSERNRPAELAESTPGRPVFRAPPAAIKSGKLTAEDIARITIEAVKADRFYMLPHRILRCGGIRMKILNRIAANQYVSLMRSAYHIESRATSAKRVQTHSRSNKFGRVPRPKMTRWVPSVRWS